ncbi:hypothetical protein BsWGS_01473 [Bradybaena similaris]
MSFSFQGAKLAMDATRKFDSIARCLNHSREPNIRFHPPFVIDLKGGLPRIASYALRDIYRGEEIVIDYGVRDGHITWLRNREIGFVADVDSDSSDDSDDVSSQDSHRGFQASERPSLPECYAPGSSDTIVSERSMSAAGSHGSKCNQEKRDPDNMAFSRGEWGVRFTSLVPGGHLNSYFAGFENIDTPQKILKCIEVASERKSLDSDTESVVCLSSSSSSNNSSSSSVSVKSTSSFRKNTFLKPSENMDGALSIELPSNEAPDSIHKVLEWQKTSPLPEGTLNIQIVGVQSLQDFPYLEQDTNSEHSSSGRQQSHSAFQAQEIPVNSHAHSSEADKNEHANSQNNHPSGSSSSSYESSPTYKNKEISVVTVDTSESDDTSVSSSLTYVSVPFITPTKQSAKSETVEEKQSSVGPAEVCVVSDDDAPSLNETECDEDESSSSECEIILTESPDSAAGTVGVIRNLQTKRAVEFSSPSAQLQVAVIEPYVSPSTLMGSNREVVAMTDSETEQLRRIFNKHIISNNAPKEKVWQAINSNWDVFNVLIQRGITLKQIRNTFNSFLKPKR